MSNTERLYQVMDAFTQARREARGKFLQEMRKYDGAQGTKYYTEKKDAAMKTRTEAVEAAKRSASAQIASIMGDIRAKIASRRLDPPTVEQMRLLDALKYRETLTEGELDQAANTMDGNGLALSILADLARKHGVPAAKYLSMTKGGLLPEEARRCLSAIYDECGKILNDPIGATYASKYAAEYQKEHYGADYNPDSLPQEKPYASKENFYYRVSPVGYDVISETMD